MKIAVRYMTDKPKECLIYYEDNDLNDVYVTPDIDKCKLTHKKCSFCYGECEYLYGLKETISLR